MTTGVGCSTPEKGRREGFGNGQPGCTNRRRLIGLRIYTFYYYKGLTEDDIKVHCPGEFILQELKLTYNTRERVPSVDK